MLVCAPTGKISSLADRPAVADGRDGQPSDAMSATGSRKSRRSRRLRRLWPACLCSSSRDQDEALDDYRPAADKTPTEVSDNNVETVNTQPTTAAAAASGDDKMAAVTSQLSGNGDVGSDLGLHTVNMSGGGPYGFRLADGEKGQLVVSKVSLFEL